MEVLTLIGLKKAKIKTTYKRIKMSIEAASVCKETFSSSKALYIKKTFHMIGFFIDC